jgi:hypothetical protein
MKSEAEAEQLEEMFESARSLILAYRLKRLSAPHVNVDDLNTFREFLVGVMAERYPEQQRELLRGILERELNRPTTRLA